MNRYIKLKGHRNWFLVLDSVSTIPDNLDVENQEKLVRTVLNGLHDNNADDCFYRLKQMVIDGIDYRELVEKYGTILVRPVGSWMTLNSEEIIQERYDIHFPIEDYSKIVICENDKVAEYKWVNYLKKRFGNESITVINFFDLRSDGEIMEYFQHAEYITFSTTFTNYVWFNKLINNINKNHKIIGYSHNDEKWDDALALYGNIEVIKNI